MKTKIIKIMLRMICSEYKSQGILAKHFRDVTLLNKCGITTIIFLKTQILSNIVIGSHLN